MCTEDDAEKNCYNGCMSHGCAEPALAILACCSSELLSSQISCRSTQKRIIFAIIRRIVVSTTIVSSIIDIAHKSACASLYSGESCSRETADRNLVIKLTRNWFDANLLIVQSANILDDNVEFTSPSPLIVTFGTIQLCWFTSSILVVILAVELPTAVVILDQVCAKPEDVWQLLQQLK